MGKLKLIRVRSNAFPRDCVAAAGNGAMTRTPLLETEQGLDCPRNDMSGPAQVGDFLAFSEAFARRRRASPAQYPQAARLPAPEVLDRVQRKNGIAVVQSNLR